MDFIGKKAKKKITALKKQDYRKRLIYNKLLAAIVERIIVRDTFRLTERDIEDISLKVYNKINKIQTKVIKRIMHADIVKDDINKLLQDFYLNAGLDRDEATNLLRLAKETAIEKKDVTNMLKIVEKYERANNLVDNVKVTQTQTQMIDYSKLGQSDEEKEKGKVSRTVTIARNGSGVSNSAGSEYNTNGAGGNDSTNANASSSEPDTRTEGQSESGGSEERS